MGRTGRCAWPRGNIRRQRGTCSPPIDARGASLDRRPSSQWNGGTQNGRIETGLRMGQRGPAAASFEDLEARCTVRRPFPTSTMSRGFYGPSRRRRGPLPAHEHAAPRWGRAMRSPGARWSPAGRRQQNQTASKSEDAPATHGGVQAPTGFSRGICVSPGVSCGCPFSLLGANAGYAVDSG